MWNTLRTAIIDKLNGAEVTKIASAYRTDRSGLNSFPSAIITPSEKSADFHSTAQDRRVYAFVVRVFYPFTEGQDEADMALEVALDELEEVFNQRETLGNACLWVEPVPSQWGYVERDKNFYRVAELVLRCVVQK